MEKDQLIDHKNHCYKLKLDGLKYGAAYKQVQESFVDTFSTIQKARTRTDLLEERVDEAVFFSSDSSECLLIVLQRHPKLDRRSFGTARIYRGQLLQNRWKFEKSIWITFDGYYEKYTDNSFEHISEVARYVVLTNGQVDFTGCEIDEYYWFKYLKE